jgi:hypothetical protein
MEKPCCSHPQKFVYGDKEIKQHHIQLYKQLGSKKQRSALLQITTSTLLMCENSNFPNIQMKLMVGPSIYKAFIK